MLYLTFKYLHLLGAIGWVGGVLILSWINWSLSRESRLQTLHVLSRFAAGFGPRFVAPAAILTLVAGMAATRSGHIPFKSPWISMGFAAVMLSILLGATLIRATNLQLTGLIEKDAQASELAAVQRRLGSLNALNLLILISAVGVMVFKPA